MRRYNAGLTVEIEYLRVQDKWAFMTGTFRLRPPNPDLEQRLYPDTAALLSKQGGGWKVLIWGQTCLPIDCIIAVAVEAQKKYPLVPRSIFPEGVAEWIALQETLRQVVVRDYRSPRRVLIDQVRIRDGWAWMTGTLQRPKRNAPEECMADYGALLKKKGAAWQVLHWETGCGMDAFMDARKRYPQAPWKAIHP
jgi:hypothetical protein